MTGAEPVDVDPVGLSPDGRWLLSHSEPFCFIALDGPGERCVDADVMTPDSRVVSWSPDRTKVAFTDYWALHEHDLWVFDMTSGELRNLTDDGVANAKGEQNVWGPHLDRLPIWSPDGETILFARGWGISEPVSLMSVPAGGGDVSTLRELPCSYGGFSGLAWTVDRVAWTCNNGDRYSVFLGEHTGDRADMVLPGDATEDRTLLSFSPDGQWLLADSVPVTHKPRQGTPLLVSVGDGEVVRVADGKIGYPTWSPDGHALAFVELPGTVRVVDEPGGEPRTLHTAEKVESPDGVRLSWAPGKLLIRADGEPLLLTLSD